MVRVQGFINYNRLPLVAWLEWIRLITFLQLDFYNNNKLPWVTRSGHRSDLNIFPAPPPDHQGNACLLQFDKFLEI